MKACIAGRIFIVSCSREQGRALGYDSAWRTEYRECQGQVSNRSLRVSVRLTFLQLSLMVNDDIETIISRGETRTLELSSKYEGLNLEDLNNFKSDFAVQQWEGEDFGKVYILI